MYFPIFQANQFNSKFKKSCSIGDVFKWSFDYCEKVIYSFQSGEIEEPRPTNDALTVTHPLDVMVGNHFCL